MIERTTMNFERSETTSEAILRIREVLQRTGLSRSTLYNRIAKRQFPHQVSLGGRAVGWLKGDIEGWINERVHLRPGTGTGISERRSDERFATPEDVLVKDRGGLSIEPTKYKISVNDAAPDPAELSLVGTKIYFDRSTGSFWLKLLAEF